MLTFLPSGKFLLRQNKSHAAGLPGGYHPLHLTLLFLFCSIKKPVVFRQPASLKLAENYYGLLGYIHAPIAWVPDPPVKPLAANV